VNTALKKPELVAKMIASGVDLTGGSPEELATYMRSESDKWAVVIKQLGFKLD
jgi:tripartite-type tricarboxylate transporter receptor subunit TctC